MERAENAIRMLAWMLRRKLNLGRQTVAPIQWGAASDVQLPTPSFSNDPNTNQKIAVIAKELQLFSRLSNRFPKSLTDRDWSVLLECESRKQRLDHINFLYGRERLKESDKVRKEEERKARLQLERRFNSDNYYISWNAARVGDEERKLAFCRIAAAHRIGGPSVAVDCRFLPMISPRGADLTAVQLQYLISANRDRRQPWPLYFCNFDSGDSRVQRLTDKHLRGMNSAYSSSPIVSSSNYTSLADKDRIVYLSPHAEEVLTEIRDDEVYVLGGIVDRVPEKGIPHHASKDTAEADGVRALRLPLNEYVKWESGNKYLTLLAVMAILQDVHANGGNWEAALKKNIPVRNTRPSEAKNSMVRDKHERIRQFNREILRIVDRRLGPSGF